MSWSEAAILAASFAWFGMFFLLFVRVLPRLLGGGDQGDAAGADAEEVGMIKMLGRLDRQAAGGPEAASTTA